MDRLSTAPDFGIGGLYGQLVHARYRAAKDRVHETVEANGLFGEGAAALEDASAVLGVIADLAPAKMNAALTDLIEGMLSVACDLELAADVAAMHGAAPHG